MFLAGSGSYASAKATTEAIGIQSMAAGFMTNMMVRVLVDASVAFGIISRRGELVT